MSIIKKKSNKLNYYVIYGVFQGGNTTVIERQKTEDEAILDWYNTVKTKNPQIKGLLPVSVLKVSDKIGEMLSAQNFEKTENQENIKEEKIKRGNKR